MAEKIRSTFAGFYTLDLVIAIKINENDYVIVIIESYVYVLYIHLFVGNDNKISISNYLSVKIHTCISVPIIGTSLRNLYLSLCGSFHMSKTHVTCTLVQGAEGDEVIDKAIKEPEKFVAKPQREGGGETRLHYIN